MCLISLSTLRSKIYWHLSVYWHVYACFSYVYVEKVLKELLIKSHKITFLFHLYVLDLPTIACAWKTEVQWTNKTLAWIQYFQVSFTPSRSRLNGFVQNNSLKIQFWKFFVWNYFKKKNLQIYCIKWCIFDLH